MRGLRVSTTFLSRSAKYSACMGTFMRKFAAIMPRHRWTSLPAFNTYRKNPSVWTHCLGKNLWLWQRRAPASPFSRHLHLLHVHLRGPPEGREAKHHSTWMVCLVLAFDLWWCWPAKHGMLLIFDSKCSQHLHIWISSKGPLHKSSIHTLANPAHFSSRIG